jgi:hypothetical protein
MIEVKQKKEKNDRFNYMKFNFQMAKDIIYKFK